MLILLDSTGLVVATLDIEPPDDVFSHGDRDFHYEDRDGDDYIYRERAS